MYPPLYQATLDHRLPDSAFRIYAYLIHELVPYELKSVKLEGVGRALRFDRSTVHRSVKLLLHLGYLERGPDDGRLFTMRISQPRTSPPDFRCTSATKSPS